MREAAQNRANLAANGANGGNGEGFPPGGFPAGGVPEGVIEEARQLAEAVLDQNRASEINGYNGSGINSGFEGRRRESSLPCFFVVTASPSVEVRSGPSHSSALIRTINKVGRAAKIGIMKTIILQYSMII